MAISDEDRNARTALAITAQQAHRIDALEGAMDEASDRLADVYQWIGRLEPRLGGDGRECIRIMNELLALQEMLETASLRKVRIEASAPVPDFPKSQPN